MVINRPGVGALALIILLVAACNSPTEPTSPVPNGLVSIAIAPNPVALHVGMTVTLLAVGQFADGHAAVVDAMWSSNPAVVQIGSSGVAKAAAIGVAAVSAAVGSVRGTGNIAISDSPDGTWPDLSGTWSGDSLSLNCTRVAGPGPSPCEGHYNGGVRLPVTLVVQQHADVAVCAATIGVIGELKGTLSGLISPDGHLHLAGSLAGSEAGVARIDDADFDLQADGTLMGTYSWTNTFFNAFGLQELTENWRLEGLARDK